MTINEKLIELCQYADRLFRADEAHFMIVVHHANGVEAVGCCEEDQAEMLEALSGPTLRTQDVTGLVRGH
jgi:hypothetical protein